MTDKDFLEVLDWWAETSIIPYKFYQDYMWHAEQQMKNLHDLRVFSLHFERILDLLTQ